MAVESPLYERAKAFLSLSAMPLASEDLAEDNRAGNAHTDVDTAKDTSECFTADESVGQSQTKSGADRWMSYFISDVNRHLQRIESSKAHHLAVREEMHTQVANTQQLNPELLSAWEIETYSGKEKVTIPDASVSARMGGAVEASGDAYLAALEAQRNEVREARAQEILNAVNTKGKQEAQSFASQKDDYVPDAWQSHGDDGQQGGAGGGGNGRRGGGGGNGRRGGGGAGGGLVPTVGAHTVAGSGSNGWAYPTAGEPGSPSNPITDPAQLSHIDLTTTPVNQRMTPNGPVGGHMPADVLNVDDPAWRAVPPSGGGARIAGGVLMATSGVGAAGVAVSHGGGFSGIGGLATGVAGSPLRSVAPAGGVLRPSALLGGGSVGRGAGVAGMRSGVAPVGSGGAGGRGGLVGSSGLSEARSGGGAAGSRGGAGSARGATGSARGTTGGRGAAGSARGAAGVVETRGAGSRGGVAGRGGAGSARGAAGVVGSGSKGRGKKKDEARRRNYEVVRVDGLDESAVGVMGGGAGSADQLRPVCRDEGEDW